MPGGPAGGVTYQQGSSNAYEKANLDTVHGRDQEGQVHDEEVLPNVRSPTRVHHTLSSRKPSMIVGASKTKSPRPQVKSPRFYTPHEHNQA